MHVNELYDWNRVDWAAGTCIFTNVLFLKERPYWQMQRLNATGLCGADPVQQGCFRLREEWNQVSLFLEGFFDESLDLFGNGFAD